MRITPVLRSLLGLASLIAVTMALLLVPATSASAAGEEGDFVNRLNALRTSRGLAPLAVYGDLTSSWERGTLGYPVSGEYAVPEGKRSDFQRGSIILDARTGATGIVWMSG